METEQPKKKRGRPSKGREYAANVTESLVIPVLGNPVVETKPRANPVTKHSVAQEYMGTTYKPGKHPIEHYYPIFAAIASGSTVQSALDNPRCNPFNISKDYFFYSITDTREEINQTISNEYSRARAAKIELEIDQIIDFADNSSDDLYTDSDGKIKVNSNAPRRDDLRIKARQWVAERLMAGKYGQKTDTNITVNVSLRDRLRAAKGNLIEMEPEKLINN